MLDLISLDIAFKIHDTTMSLDRVQARNIASCSGGLQIEPSTKPILYLALRDTSIDLLQFSLIKGDPTRSKAGFSPLFRKRGLDGSIDRLFGNESLKVF